MRGLSQDIDVRLMPIAAIPVRVHPRFGLDWGNVGDQNHFSKATQPPSAKGRLCASVLRSGRRCNGWIGRHACYLHFVIPAIAMWASASVL